MRYCHLPSSPQIAQQQTGRCRAINQTANRSTTAGLQGTLPIRWTQATPVNNTHNTTRDLSARTCGWGLTGVATKRGAGRTAGQQTRNRATPQHSPASSPSLAAPSCYHWYGHCGCGRYSSYCTRACRRCCTGPWSCAALQHQKQRQGPRFIQCCTKTAALNPEACLEPGAVAQLDSASVYGTGGWRLEPSQDQLQLSRPWCSGQTCSNIRTFTTDTVCSEVHDKCKQIHLLVCWFSPQ